MILRSIEVENLVFFSDAVFAFSITLMALSIQIPHISANISEELLTKSLQGLLPSLSQYVFSFIVVAIYWNRYHRIFNYITHTNSIITGANLVFLLSISLLPSSTAIVTQYNSHRIAVIVFSSVMAITGLILCFIWWYAANNLRLVDKEEVQSKLIRHFLVLTCITPSIFLVSIAISFIDIQIAKYFWILVIPANLIIRKGYLSRPSV